MHGRGLSQRALQGLLLRRFVMAMATYALVLLLTAVAMVAGLYRYSYGAAVTCWSLVLLTQFCFFVMFRSGFNLRFHDPSLTEPQVLVALGWLSVLNFQLLDGHGALTALYVLALLFAVFFLEPRRFIRCAALAFLGFVAARLAAAWREAVTSAAVIVLEACLFLAVLIWLCLAANYAQHQRRRMRQRRHALQAHQETLRGMMRQLENLASTDELTGLYNRRHFLRLAERACLDLTPGVRHGLALIDLDHFKRINDRYGHAAGDRVLQTFAAIARDCLREEDVIARYGGEEFVLLIAETDAEGFTRCCERLREGFAAAEPEGVPVDGLSLSVGMTLIATRDALDDALQRADRALYRAKGEGRNRCVAAWESGDV